MDDLSWVGYDLSAYGIAIRRWSDRVAMMVEGLDPVRASAPAENVEWSISEVTAHLVAVAVGNLAYLGGSRERWYDLTDMKDSGKRSIENVDERAPAILAPQLKECYLAVAGHADDSDPLNPVPWHNGHELPMAATLGICLGELVVHGRDMADALKLPWRLDPGDAALVVRASFAFAPYVVDLDVARSRPVTYDVRIKGLPATTWRFDAAGLTLTPAARGARVDCHLSTDPVTFLLVAYGRRSALNRALVGKAIAWGRRPIAGLRMADYLTAG